VTEECVPVFGAELRRLRTAAGLSLAQLSREVHYSKGYLSKIETGVRLPAPDLARRCDDAVAAGGALLALVPPRRQPRQPAETWDFGVAELAVPRSSAGSQSPPGLRAAPEPALPVRAAFRPLVDHVLRATGPAAVLRSFRDLAHRSRTDLLLRAARLGDYARLLAEESNDANHLMRAAEDGEWRLFR
jgi:transcriptional regulator with XRE-family HTH domain